MYIDQKPLTPEKVKRSSVAATIILVILFIGLLFLFWHIQILKNHQFKSLALKNIYREKRIKAPRGIILDRNQKILAENKLNFSLFLVKENIKDLEAAMEKAAEITELEKKSIEKQIGKYLHSAATTLIPIKKNLSLKKVIYLQSRSDEFSEFEIDIEPSRAYPFKKTASHILGYVSEISTGELNQPQNRHYRLGDEIGKIGIEKQYESFIRGEKGTQLYIKDSHGNIQKMVSEKKPQIGHSIVLTIDIQLQEFIEDLFQRHKGTIAVADLSSGGILALVSKPNFNPERFTSLMSPEEWSALINNPDKPLHNKFTQGLYSPGSVFKIVMSLAGLQERIINPSTRVFCSGAVKIYNRTFHCWAPMGHGSMNLTSAIQNSCNVYFYTLGEKMDVNTIEKYARLLGLGRQTGLGLPNEKTGLIPTPAWKKKKLGETWYPGETISLSIGGGLLTITPSQILRMISTVALRGKMPRLHLLKRIEKKGNIIKETKPVFHQVAIEPRYFDLVIQGLYQVVNDEGTGRAASIPGMEICGKTGTQQIISKENPNYRQLVKQKRFRPHSWFASFAPRPNPRYAVVVFVEHGGDAGEVAAPIAATIYKKLMVQ